MTRESLVRKFRPAGFDRPEGSRHDYTKPRRELQETFYKWVKEMPDNYICLEDEYQQARLFVKSLGEIPYKEANSLLVDFKPKRFFEREAGLFVSACYNKSPEQAIILDLDAPQIKGIGYRLERNKILVNNGVIGDAGRMADGTIVNNGETISSIPESGGLFINNGRSGPLIDGPENIGLYRASRLITQGCEMVPELVEYLDELRDLSKSIKDEQSAKKFLERYGPNPGKRIQNEVMEIAKKSI